MTEPNLYNVGYDVGFEDGFKEAQGRIKELEAKLKNMAMDNIAADFSSEVSADRIRELEAKLAKAVAQMQRVKDFRYDPSIGIELNFLEKTLAELTGGKNE